MIRIALALLAQPVEPPTTVNDQILGKAEDFVVRGPARVCLIRTSIDLKAGETSYLHYLGIHWGSLRVATRNGTILVHEGDSWSAPKGGRPFEAAGNNQVVQLGRGSTRKYFIYGPDDTLAVRVEGEGLGHGQDRQFIGRIQMGEAPPKDCRRRFRYGWDFILGTEDEQ